MNKEAAFIVVVGQLFLYKYIGSYRGLGNGRYDFQEVL